MTDNDQKSFTYSLCNNLNFRFSPREDRLVLNTVSQKPITVFFTRRMVLLLLQELAKQVPKMMDLTQIPTQFWDEALSMEHQQAAVSAAAESKLHTQPTKVAEPQLETEPATPYLAYEFITKREENRLILAFNGFSTVEYPHPEQHEELFAIIINSEKIHQFMQILFKQAELAQWDLPITINWMTKTADIAAPSGISH